MGEYIKERNKYSGYIEYKVETDRCGTWYLIRVYDDNIISFHQFPDKAFENTPGFNEIRSTILKKLGINNVTFITGEDGFLYIINDEIVVRKNPGYEIFMDRNGRFINVPKEYIIGKNGGRNHKNLICPPKTTW